MMTTKKKTKKILSKEAILAEARQLFSSRGYRATTLQDLTSSFGVSRPSLYYYFKNKMELLLELHSQGYTKAVKSLEEILFSEASTREKFRKILEVHTRNMASEAKIHKIFFMNENEMPDKLIREMRKRRRDYTNRIVEIYQRGIDEGIFREMDPKTVVYLLVGACNWITMWYSPEKSIDPETIVQSLLTLLCEGYEK